MIRPIYILIVVLFAIFDACSVWAQENILTHYFATSSYFNPASAGDTRFIQAGLVNRIQSMSSATPILNTLLTFDHKLRNHRSGIGFTLNQKNSGIKETQLKLNYSHTWPLNERYLMRAGLGLSWNFLNSRANSYHYPDQFNQFGITGEPTNELYLNENENYPAFAAGVLVYDEFAWASLSADYLNMPKQNFAGQKTKVPMSFTFHAGYLFQIDKYDRPRRIINPKGGLEPYSSIGPVVGFSRQGPFYNYSIGVNTFLRPVYSGLSYRQNNYSGENLKHGVSSLNLLLGYRNEKISLSYSYDFMISRTVTNYRGAHEISLVYYIYTIKVDYKMNKLVPFPNQLMY